MRAPVSGLERIVGVDELFFSTTDRRGIITRANSVFVELAGYTRADIIGSPHNIVRHPQMPQGIFALMWDRLHSGQPMVAYVQLRAKDGSSYGVLAAMTPLDDGYLSVRAAPCRPDLWDVAAQLYARVLPVEAQARAAGYSKADAAQLGATMITRELGTLGFASYDDFMRTVLPAEVAARAPQTTLSAARPDVVGHLGALLAATHGLGLELATLLELLETYRTLGDSLRAASQGALVTLADLGSATVAAAHASEAMGTRAPILTRTAAAMSTLALELTERIGSLAHRLDQLHAAVIDLRFGIALTTLHNDMATSFAIEVAEGRAPAEALDYVPPLCRTIEYGARSVSDALTGASTGLRDVAAQLLDTEKQLADFQHMLASWRIFVTRYGVATQLDAFVAPIDAQLRAGRTQMGVLRSAARHCLADAQPFDPERLRAPAVRVSHVSAELVRSRTTG